MGTTYKNIYIPAIQETGWGTLVNANWTLLADREELVRKTAPESVTSSTTVQNDNELLYTMTANHTWAFKLVALVSNSAATNQFRSNFSVPSGASWSYLAVTNAVTPVTLASVPGADYTSSTLSATAAPVVYDGIVTCGATAGNFQFQWAQGSSSGTAVTVATNSYLLMKLLV
jgi:hypothetical protein